MMALLGADGEESGGKKHQQQQDHHDLEDREAAAQRLGRACDPASADVTGGGVGA
jgi:hypothetical protein